jgi:hypothetical protein
MSDLSATLARLESAISWSGGPSEKGVLSSMSIVDGHRDLLSRHDGVLALEGGLRCFGITEGLVPSLAAWNRADGWRAQYRSLAEGLLFFAEDAFGNQFAFEDERIVRFHAESGDREFMSDSFGEWLSDVLNDPDEELSLWLLREWKRPGNVIRPDQHLCPKIPFVTGGPFEPGNLYPLDRIESMTFKGDFAWQIRNVPTGGKIRLKTVD